MAELVRKIPGGVRAFDNPFKKNDPDYLREIAGKELSAEQLIDIYTKYPNLIATPVLVIDGEGSAGSIAPEELARRVGVPA